MPEPSALAHELAERIDALVARELTKIKSPAVRAQVAHELHDRLGATASTVRALRADAIRNLRKADVTWPAIADLLGVTPQRAQQMSTPSLTAEVTAP